MVLAKERKLEKYFFSAFSIQEPRAGFYILTVNKLRQGSNFTSLSSTSAERKKATHAWLFLIESTFVNFLPGLLNNQFRGHFFTALRSGNNVQSIGQIGYRKQKLAALAVFDQDRLVSDTHAVDNP